MASSLTMIHESFYSYRNYIMFWYVKIKLIIFFTGWPPKSDSRGLKFVIFLSMTENLLLNPLTRRLPTLSSSHPGSALTSASSLFAWAIMSSTCAGASPIPSRCNKWKHKPEKRNSLVNKKGNLFFFPHLKFTILICKLQVCVYMCTYALIDVHCTYYRLNKKMLNFEIF